DGAASIEVRVPFLQVRQGISSSIDPQKLQGLGLGNLPANAAITDPANSLGDSFVGDMTLVGKYAILDNRDNGNLISVGLALTVPTGQSVTVGGPAQLLAPPTLPFAAPVGPLVPVFPGNQNFRDVLFQPFVGYIYNIDRFYLHGFESVVLPTDSRDATILFSDFGVGYNLLQRPEGLIRGITPTIEGHLTNGLNHNNGDGGATIADVFSINAGVHIQLGARSILSFGVSTPLTGPRPYRIESMVLFNYVF
ncbi:MAG: hypothetical protein HY040_18060, partial [Planctomycetes bacterium]|nr:hypothetical protein [Planctomycetota bacterium]